MMRRGRLLGIATIVVLLAAWETTARVQHNVYVPPPSQVAVTFVHEWFSPQFMQQAMPSLERLVAGFAIATVIGVTLGIAIGVSDALYRTLDPILQVLRALPPTAVIPVGILLLGIGDAMKVAVIVFGAVWPILVNSADGARCVSTERLDTARNFGLSRFETVVAVTFPSALPQIFAGLRIGLALAFIMIVISEMVGGSNGLGYAILSAQRTFSIPEMYAGIALLAVLGYTLNALFTLVEHRVLAWHIGSTTVTR
jgi:ABC-type nitrate/sulfonate/bicarbonate transport system permease component